jgi:hypothetical protein
VSHPTGPAGGSGTVPTAVNAGNSGLAAANDEPSALTVGALGLAFGSAGVLVGMQRRRSRLARRDG